MSKRPYFRYSGEELKTLFTESKNDIETLTALKFELGHRKYSKSRLLETEIEKTITSLYNPEATDIQVQKIKAIEVVRTSPGPASLVRHFTLKNEPISRTSGRTNVKMKGIVTNMQTY